MSVELKEWRSVDWKVAQLAKNSVEWKVVESADYSVVLKVDMSVDMWGYTMAALWVAAMVVLMAVALAVGTAA